MMQNFNCSAVCLQFYRDTSTAKARAKSGGAESLLRMRSNSLSDHSPEKRNRHSTGVTAQSSQQQQQLTLPSLNQDQDIKRDKMMAFHSELSDTCVDILSTYAYANLSAKPKRIGELLSKNPFLPISTLYYTVWKLPDFSITQILRENNFVEF